MVSYDETYEPSEIIIYVQGKGIVLREKSLIAFQKSDNRIVAVGSEAERIVGGDAEDIVVMSPLHQGVVADYKAAMKLFSYLFVKAQVVKPFRKPAVVVCVPEETTEMEKKAMEETLLRAGAGKIMVEKVPVEKFIREFPERSPELCRKFKVIVGIN